MDGKKILILGGYGTVGSLVARLLLKESDVKLVLAGRNIDKAQATAEELNSGRGGRRVEGAYADAADMESVKEAAKGAQCILMASTTVRYAHQVTRAALESKIDYMDVPVLAGQDGASHRDVAHIRNAGLCYIADCGIAPGLAAMLVRWAAPQFDALKSARVGAALRMDWTERRPVRETVRESLRVLNTYKHKVYRRGVAEREPAGDASSMDFGEDLGRQIFAAMFIEEMRAATRAYPSIKEARFGMGGFNWFTTWVTFPVATAALWLSRGALLGPMGGPVRLRQIRETAVRDGPEAQGERHQGRQGEGGRHHTAPQ